MGRRRYDPEVGWDFDVKFTINRSLTRSEEPSEFVLDIDGQIVPDAPEEALPIGWIGGRVIQAGRALNAQESLFDVCDSVDQSLHEAACAIYDFERGRFREGVSDGCAGHDVLLVDEITILPAHRGQGLGLLALLRTIETFGEGCAVTLIKPFPLQHSAGFRPPPEMAYEAFTCSRREAFSKLRAHWRRLGFEPIAGNEDYYTLDMQSVIPTGVEILDAPRKSSKHGQAPTAAP